MSILKKKTSKKRKASKKKKTSKKTTRKKTTSKRSTKPVPKLHPEPTPVTKGNNGQMGPTKPELIHGGLKTNEEGEVVLMGRPVHYNGDYPEMLVRHMCQGHSFWSFAAVCKPQVCRRTLQYWLEKYSDFQEAREIGRQGDLKFLEDISKAGMTGTLRRVSEENVVRGSDGQPIRDNEGMVLTDKKYSQARYCPKTWSMLMKNRHNFAEKIEVKSKNYTAVKKIVGDLSDAEIEKELSEIENWEENYNKTNKGEK